MAKSERKKPPAPPGQHIEIDAWALKCLYNTSDYEQRIESGEFIPLHTEPSRWRAGERTVQVYYGREDDKLLRVRLQWFENEKGEILRSGLKEPKQMYWDGIDYHMPGGEGFWYQLRRDPTGLLPLTTNRFVIRLKQRYGDWRRYKCARLGAIEARWRSRLFTSDAYAFYRRSVDFVPVAWIRLRQATKPLRSLARRIFSGPRARALVLP